MLVETLTSLSPEALIRSLYGPHEESETYEVRQQHTIPGGSNDLPPEITFTLSLRSLPTPVMRDTWSPHDDDIDRYARIASSPDALSFGARTTSGVLIGIVIAELETWNSSVKIWDLRVHSDHRRNGIGRRLIAAVVDRARSLEARMVVLESQNWNVAALRFYTRLGFMLEGVDTSFYGAQALAEQDVAVFLKLRL